MVDTGSIASRATLDLLDQGLRQELERSVTHAAKAGAVFHGSPGLSSLFHDAVQEAITSIEARGDLLRRFLELGPYEREDDIPPTLKDRRLSDEETTRAIAFIYCHIVNSFQGALTELLAAGPISELVEGLKTSDALPAESRGYLGNSVLVASSNGIKKGADAHVLVPLDSDDQNLRLVGVVEVKSYRRSYCRVLRQLKAHVVRTRKGLQLSTGGTSKFVVPIIKGVQPVLISVFPSSWRLLRTFWFEDVDGRRLLRTPPIVPPLNAGVIEQIGKREWRIVLPWSREAIASSAYELTYWYMGELGAEIYKARQPDYLKKMSPKEAGMNTAKMMLYYAIARCRTNREGQRAIALYNTYGFGYALGMNFRSKNGQRQMLWPEDLHELEKNPFTKHGDSFQ